MAAEINSRQVPGELFEGHLRHTHHARSVGVTMPSFPSSFHMPMMSSIRGDANSSRMSPLVGRPVADARVTRASSSLSTSTTQVHSQSKSSGQSGMYQQEIATKGQTSTPVEGSTQKSKEAPTKQHSPPPRPAKRKRAYHDVDGPGTDMLPSKKRRLLLHFTTSPLSRPFSSPATHILIRESTDDMPVLHRIQRAAAVAARRVGHQSSLVRKAAILNRIRIGVRQSALLRGHAIMVDMAARNNALQHGLQVVTGPASGLVGARFPESNVEMNLSTPPMVNGRPVNAVPATWRPHTRTFHPPMSLPSSSPPAPAPTREDVVYDSGGQAPPVHVSRESTSSLTSPTPPKERPPHRVEVDTIEEEDHTAFPSSSFHDRYADFSDDDMDDVYADFGVLFGSRSPEPGNPADEHFYEELLDELDGIPWIS